jgi:sugar lactone lactonase YvrE
MSVTVAVPLGATLGEGPVWLPATRQLACVDILAPAIILADPLTGRFQRFPMPEPVGAVVPRRHGGWLAALRSGLVTVDLATGALTTIARPEAHKPGNRFNDGKCDRRGRFFIGSMAMDQAPGQGSLYRFDPDGRCTPIDHGFTVANGLGWSPDDRLFYMTDSGARRIDVYDYDIETGAVQNRRPFRANADDPGVPDGLAVDAEGHVWSARWDGGCVMRFDPDGRVDRVIAMPVPRPTSVAFGGDDLATLFVTSARVRLSDGQLAQAPLSGHVLQVAAGARGLPEVAFAG